MVNKIKSKLGFLKLDYANIETIENNKLPLWMGLSFCNGSM